MKRAASPSTATSRRSTRASTRHKKEQDDRKKEQDDREQEKANLAVRLMSTPLLQALPAVLSSGYLYHHECITAASTCQNWYHLWKEVEDEFPEDSLVEIEVKHISSSRNNREVTVPTFIQNTEGLLEAFHTQQFSRQIFDKANELKVAAKPGKTAKKRCREGLPKWGIDVRRVKILYWGPVSRNHGGIYISYCKHTGAVMQVRIDHELPFWTLNGIRQKTWAKACLWAGSFTEIELL
ncbi:expressed unknown protein [Seminavis robusta]|uniref:Uncharacterized protein n=1 Tax=Seminavis robusta TaxID=568900 RepID=A0A9N8DAZ1_9STRA|nr:expressed unknown protein [Seminavis robusta]|eukprot:Sro20_g013930.1 n/a (238) ;mRNA; f:38299-39012